MVIEDKVLEYIMRLVSKLIKENFTGNIQINFRCGGVTNINKTESFKIDKD